MQFNNPELVMSTEGTLQPTLELLSTKIAQAQTAYVSVVQWLFRDAPRPVQELVATDVSRLMDAQSNRGVHLESVADLLAITQLVREKGWELFLAIDPTHVTGSIVKLQETYGLTVGGAATLFYTRTSLEPARMMLTPR